MTEEIEKSEVIDSRDIIARIDDLEGREEELTEEEAEELEELRKLASEAESSPDWQYGETLIRDDYFVTYIEEFISDCYGKPEGFNSGEWPWRHMTMDYEAAAQEALQDYFDVELFGTTYWIRG